METMIPRAEYPRPQLVRDSYIPLNGTWMFEIDNGRTGRERKLQNAEMLSGTITVPFCPESKLSGVEHKDFMAQVWYKREIEIASFSTLMPATIPARFMSTASPAVFTSAAPRRSYTTSPIS